jgi:transitional endoplasmic reticulum ATPase
MGKKKKKPARGIGSPQVQHLSPVLAATPAREAPPLVDAVDWIHVGLVRSSKSSSLVNSTHKHRVDSGIPCIRLTESDAARLDVQNNEKVLVLSIPSLAKDSFVSNGGDIMESNGSNLHSLQGAILARVQISESGLDNGGLPSSTRRRSSLQVTLPVGSAQLVPDSAVDSLMLDKRVDWSSGSASPPVSSKSLSVNTKPTSTPSPADTRFSFARGGGGDLLYTTPEKALRVSPVGKAKAAPSVWIVPVDSDLGDVLSSHLFAPAKRVEVAMLSSGSVVSSDADPDGPASLDESIRGAENIFSRIIAAQYAGRCIQVGEELTASFRGAPCSLQVLTVDCGEAGLDDRGSNTLAESLKELRIGNGSESILLGNCDENPGRLNYGGLIQQAAQKSSVRLYTVADNTRFEVSSLAAVESPAGGDENMKKAPEKLPSQYVTGLSEVLSECLSLLRTPFDHPELFTSESGGSMRPPRGLLLHGPSGVGKSCLARQIAQEMSGDGRISVHFVHCATLQSQTAIVGQAERELSRLFRRDPESMNKSYIGRLLVFDDVHLICPRRGGHSSGTDQLAATLLSLIDGIGSSSFGGDNAGSTPFMILAVTTNPSLLDPALRRAGRLDTEVEVPLPDDARSRAEILRFHAAAAVGTDGDQSQYDWLALGKQAKGFTGADCALAIKEASQIAVLRQMQSKSDTCDRGLFMTQRDLSTAIRSIKPSAIKAVVVEIPQVHWTSIGGMDSVKKELREAIELPLERSDLFAKLHIPPARGILLYGPPGCSKTLMARALATEGQMNFLAVKGPELLSKWLGESERALAALFRRARLASPCIIFFDEIDAIAASRGSGDSAGATRLLSQLLTEIDGVQHGGLRIGGDSLSKKPPCVVVVAATNRPDLLDSALTRQGRIDRAIYVGVPDADSRAQILRLGLKDKACDPDVDVARLASDEFSAGFSGAEIVAICRDAALLALEDYESKVEKHDRLTPVVSFRHVKRAMEETTRQITPAMLDFYESFRRTAHVK